MESNELKEGDWLYHFGNVKEEVLVSSDESEDPDYNETDDSDDENVNSSSSSRSIQDEKDEETKQTFNDENSESSDGVFTHSFDDKITISTNSVESTGANETSHDQNVNESLIVDKSTDQTDFEIPSRKTRFSSKNKIDRYCFNCKKVANDRWGKKKLQNCQKCNTPFKYRCINCNKGSENRLATFLHVKNDCELVRMFHCSQCYYGSTKKENLAEHAKIKHTILECPKCNEKCENCQMTKHQLYECNLKTSLNEDTSKVTLVNIKGFRKQPKHWHMSYFLEHYCKSCDKIVENVQNYKIVNKCDCCKSTLQYQCAICCKYFNRLMCAYSHIRNCSTPPRFCCAQCDFNTCYKRRLMDHMHDRHLPTECKICGMMCENGRSLNNHEKFDCKQNPFFRGIKRKRKQQISVKNKKAKPIRVQSEKEKPIRQKRKKIRRNGLPIIKFYCPQCDEITERNTAKGIPCATCGTDQKFHCGLCNLARFDKFIQAYRHLKRNFCTQPHRCRRCNFRASNSEQLLEHKIQRHSQVRVECPKCGNSFTEAAFEKHKGECGRPPKYGCTLCWHTFKERMHLKMHVISEHGDTVEKLFCLCVVCGRRMTSKHLTKHLRKYCLGTKDNPKVDGADCIKQNNRNDNDINVINSVANDGFDDDVICLDDLKCKDESVGDNRNSIKVKDHSSFPENILTNNYAMHQSGIKCDVTGNKNSIKVEDNSECSEDLLPNNYAMDQSDIKCVVVNNTVHEIKREDENVFNSIG